MSSKRVFVLEGHTLAGFVGAVTVLVALPGPNTALILTHTLAGGRRAGLATAAGVELGTAVHTFAAALGLSTIVSTSEQAFAAIRLAGAGILVFIGTRELLRARDPAGARPASMGVGSAMGRAFVGNVLNPKVAIFFLAFLPQWVDPSRGSIVLQFLFLGATVSAIGFLFGTGTALAAGALADRLDRHPALWRWQRRLTGALLVAIGARLVLPVGATTCDGPTAARARDATWSPREGASP